LNGRWANRLKLESQQAVFAALQTSRLLTDEQLRLLPEFADDASDCTQILGDLTLRRWLTPWQAQELRAGRSNFHLGKYTLIALVGRGKNGVVYQARHAETQHVVAIKVMAAEIASNERKLARFLREIRLVSALQSPHVVLALDAGCLGDCYFLVTEFLRGRNLLQWMQREPSLPIAWACECVRQAAVGLQHVHERGLLHRDLKPANVMVTADSVDTMPQVRILDLGLGRFVTGFDEQGDLTVDGRTLGTLAYMAPEQIKSGRDADVRSDIYALGCTLFQSLGRRLPFEGLNIEDTIIAKFANEPPRLEAFRADVPLAIADLVARMMRREPNERPQRAEDVAQALRPFSVASGSQPKESAEGAEIVPDFFEFVQTMQKAPLDCCRPRQGVSWTQRSASWLRRSWNSLSLVPLRSRRKRQRRGKLPFRMETDDPNLSIP
jgi:serine/threonine protein kinase